jgi:hypothetical protein
VVPGPELEKFLRETAHLPELPDEMLEMRRQMAMENSIMQFADQRMQFLGMQQKAEMIGQGYTPEQAMMAAEQPNDEMPPGEGEGDAQAQGRPDQGRSG